MGDVLGSCWGAAGRLQSPGKGHCRARPMEVNESSWTVRGGEVGAVGREKGSVGHVTFPAGSKETGFFSLSPAIDPS